MAREPIRPHSLDYARLKQPESDKQSEPSRPEQTHSYASNYRAEGHGERPTVLAYTNGKNPDHQLRLNDIAAWESAASNTSSKDAGSKLDQARQTAKEVRDQEASSKANDKGELESDHDEPEL